MLFHISRRVSPGVVSVQHHTHTRAMMHRRQKIAPYVILLLLSVLLLLALSDTGSLRYWSQQRFPQPEEVDGANILSQLSPQQARIPLTKTTPLEVSKVTVSEEITSEDNTASVGGKGAAAETAVVTLGSAGTITATNADESHNYTPSKVTIEHPLVTTSVRDAQDITPTVITTPQPQVTTQQPQATTQKPQVTTQQPQVTTQKPQVTTQQPQVTTRQPQVTTQQPQVTTRQPQVTTQQPQAVEETSRVSSGILPGASSRIKPPFYLDQTLTAFFNYMERPQVACPEVRYMGGVSRNLRPLDGQKAVCLAGSFNITPGNCLVYSFGISNEWSFDDAMADFGCQVFSFDPTMGVGDHRRSERVFFYSMGVGPLNTKMEIKKGINSSIRTLQGIINMLGHTNKMIDYLKMDIEGWEFTTLQQVMRETQLLRQVKQLGVEVHPGKEYLGITWDMIVELEYLGFTTFDARRTPHSSLWYTDPALPGKTLAQCYELAWAQVDYPTW